MAEFTVNAAEFEGLRRHLAEGDFALVPARAFIRDAGKELRRQVALRTPVDTGYLRSKISVQIQDAGLTAVVGTNVNYAPHVEFGTRPHYPPLDDLLRWVQRKQIAGRYSVKTKRRLGNKFDRSVEDVAATRAIQRKIGRKGTPPRRMFQLGIAASQPYIQQRAGQALDEMERLWRS